MGFEFADQVAVVVGAASGIGMSTAIEFRRAGATVGWFDRSANVSAVAKDHEPNSHAVGSSSSWVVDATDDAQHAELVELYFRRVGGYEEITVLNRTPEVVGYTDPVYVVRAQKCT